MKSDDLDMDIKELKIGPIIFRIVKGVCRDGWSLILMVDIGPYWSIHLAISHGWDKPKNTVVKNSAESGIPGLAATTSPSGRNNRESWIF